MGYSYVFVRVLMFIVMAKCSATGNIDRGLREKEQQPSMVELRFRTLIQDLEKIIHEAYSENIPEIDRNQNENGLGSAGNIHSGFSNFPRLKRDPVNNPPYIPRVGRDVYRSYGMKRIEIPRLTRSIDDKGERNCRYETTYGPRPGPTILIRKICETPNTK